MRYLFNFPAELRCASVYKHETHNKCNGQLACNIQPTYLKLIITAVTRKLVITAVMTKLVSTAVPTKLVVAAITTKLVVSAYF